MRRLAPWAVVLALALVYPLAVLASGAPRFPSRGECVRPATEDGDIEALFGYFDSVQKASVLRDKALAVGFQGTEVQADACGLVQVSVGGIPTLEVGREFAEQARSVGFEVTLVQAD
ncbi:MAG TPA: hypothetical protein VFU34_07860 [Gaiellaceae bacterium]|nr:hypothetical protein [Gaiellaceae bacterium]